MTCSVEGCPRKRYARGWCKAHYLRWLSWGDPHGWVRPTPVERFWASFTRAASGCWEWNAETRGGYGRFFVSGRRESAHRFAYELLAGLIPEGMEIDHLCRNRACVNPAHLEAVSHQENVLRGGAPPATNARKTHCLRGHEFTEATTRRDYAGCRQCLICDGIRRAERGHLDA